MESDLISPSTGSIKPIPNVLIDNTVKVADTLSKFRNLNEQGIFGAQFWDRDTTDESTNNGLAKISNASKGQHDSNLFLPLNDVLEWTKMEENIVNDETSLPTEFIGELTDRPKKADVKDIPDNTLQVSNDSEFEFQGVNDNEVSHKFERKSANPDMIVNKRPLIQEIVSVNESSNILGIASPESTEIIEAMDSEAKSREEKTDNVNVEINVNISDENIAEKSQTWKNGDILFNDSSSIDLSESTNATEFEELVTKANDLDKLVSNPDSLNSAAGSENTVFEQATDVTNMSTIDSKIESIQTNARISTRPEPDEYDSEDIFKTNDSDMFSETSEMIEPSELSLSELINNVKNISGLLDSFNLTEPIGFEVVTDNISSINLQSVDETQVLKDGTEIALFQEQPATGFEFLLDSEIAKNILIRDILSTSGFLENEINDHIAFISENESLDSGTEIREFNLENVESEILSTVIANVSDPLQETLNLFENSSDIVNSSPEVIMTEVVSASTAGSASDTSPTKCPNHGICIFWFFAHDRCTDNNDCGKSEICCRVRCSKRCVNV